MGSQFGKLYNDAADAALSADGMTVNALRLFLWLMRHSVDGSRLEGRDRAALENWIADNGLGCKTGEVQVSRFSHGMAATIFNGSKTEAKRQIDRLIRCNILSKAGKPARGHAQIYVIAPNRYTSRCALNPDDEAKGDTSECVPNQNKYTSNGKKYTSGGEWVHIDPRISTHPEAVTCDDVSPSDIHQIITSEGSADRAAEGAAANPLHRCPSCGKPDGVIATEGGLFTCSCGTAWRE